ncbi:hypothetical protein CY652_05315 [Burkholderia sp. WAC0059]|uniref:DUF5594 family protein n=1 Tax=Burkholderia sp. WAC0059 TaxID=2066022 RepID=UPI000C7F3FCB|nr:DUF5594 family protein [Burkholderia sp. WAC0059]PLZ03238.1 hypothetical protein CY652_05315 [Burkholderia sp. WAC0059]
MNDDVFRQFETRFAPRIAEHLAGRFGPGVRVEVLPRTGRGHPTRVRIAGEPHGHRHPYPFALNLSLTWDSDEIDRLMEPDGEARFARYLEATVSKLRAWESVRSVDFASCTQGEPEILIGGLDFEA